MLSNSKIDERNFGAFAISPLDHSGRDHSIRRIVGQLPLSFDEEKSQLCALNRKTCEIEFFNVEILVRLEVRLQSTYR